MKYLVIVVFLGASLVGCTTMENRGHYSVATAGVLPVVKHWTPGERTCTNRRWRERSLWQELQCALQK